MRISFDFFRADPKLALYGMLVAFGSGFGQTYFISQFGGEIRQDFGLTDAEFGSIYGLGTLISAFVIVYTGGLIDRVDLRRWTLVLIPCCAIACLSMAISSGVIALLITIFLLRQTGQGLMSHTMGHSLGRYSRVGRGQAIAFGSYGFPISEAVLPLLGVMAIAAIGWRETWYVLAAVYLAIVLPLALFLLRGHSERYAAWKAEINRSKDLDALGDRPAPSAAPVPSYPGSPPTPASLPGRSWRRKDVLKDIRFYLVLPGIMAPSFVITGLLLHGVRIAEMKGWSPEVWAAGLVGYAIASIPVSMTFGAFVDRVGAARGLPYFLPPLFVSCLVLAWGEGIWAVPTFMALSGISAGMVLVLSISLWAETYGTEYLGEIKAMITAIGVFSSAAAPPILGWMLDANWAVSDLALACAAYATVGLVLSLVAMRRYLAS